MLFMSCVCQAFAFVHYCLVVTRMERADLLALVCDVYCDFVTFPFGILEQVWYLIVSIPGPCRLSYFSNKSWSFENIMTFWSIRLYINYTTFYRMECVCVCFFQY